MRAKLAAAVLALSLLSAPFIATPSFAAISQAEVVTQCKVSPAACTAATKLFITENKDNPALIAALVKTLSTDKSIPADNIVAGIQAVVAATQAGGVLAGVFSATQLAALETIQTAVVTAGGAVEPEDLPGGFSQS